MKLLDYEPLLIKLKNRYSLSLTLFIILIILTLTGFIISAIKINYVNQNIVKIISLSISFILSLLIFIILFVFVIPLKNNINHINKILNNNKTKAIGTITSIKENVTIDKILVTEIDFNDGDDNWVSYFDSSYFDNQFHIGDKLSYIVSGNFIFAIGDKENEKDQL